MATLDIIYALLLLVGGVTGYARARSLPSLLASAIAAALMVAAAFLFRHQPRLGLEIGIGVSLLIGLFFVDRFRRTKKPMPAFPVVALSLIVLIASINRLR